MHLVGLSGHQQARATLAKVSHFLQNLFVAHCPDIHDPGGEVINYTSQWPLPNPKIHQNWRINKQIHPLEKWPVRTTAFIRWVM